MKMSNVDFETLLLRSWMSGGSGLLGGIDWLTLLALLVVGVLYFLAGVFGYRQRGLVLASLWVLILKLGLALLRVCILALEILDRPKVAGSGGSSTTAEMLIVLLNVFETGLFFLGLVLFVIGLSALRRDMDLPRSVPRGFQDE